MSCFLLLFMGFICKSDSLDRIKTDFSIKKQLNDKIKDFVLSPNFKVDLSNIKALYIDENGIYILKFENKKIYFSINNESINSGNNHVISHRISNENNPSLFTFKDEQNVALYKLDANPSNIYLKTEDFIFPDENNSALIYTDGMYNITLNGNFSDCLLTEFQFHNGKALVRSFYSSNQVVTGNAEILLLNYKKMEENKRSTMESINKRLSSNYRSKNNRYNLYSHAVILTFTAFIVSVVFIALCAGGRCPKSSDSSTKSDEANPLIGDDESYCTKDASQISRQENRKKLRSYYMDVSSDKSSDTMPDLSEIYDNVMDNVNSEIIVKSEHIHNKLEPDARVPSQPTVKIISPYDVTNSDKSFLISKSSDFELRTRARNDNSASNPSNLMSKSGVQKKTMHSDLDSYMRSNDEFLTFKKTNRSISDTNIDSEYISLRTRRSDISDRNRVFSVNGDGETNEPESELNQKVVKVNEDDSSYEKREDTSKSSDEYTDSYLSLNSDKLKLDQEKNALAFKKVSGDLGESSLDYASSNHSSRMNKMSKRENNSLSPSFHRKGKLLQSNSSYSADSQNNNHNIDSIVSRNLNHRIKNETEIPLELRNKRKGAVKDFGSDLGYQKDDTISAHRYTETSTGSLNSAMVRGEARLSSSTSSGTELRTIGHFLDSSGRKLAQEEGIQSRKNRLLINESSNEDKSPKKFDNNDIRRSKQAKSGDYNHKNTHKEKTSDSSHTSSHYVSRRSALRSSTNQSSENEKISVISSDLEEIQHLSSVAKVDHPKPVKSTVNKSLSSRDREHHIKGKENEGRDAHASEKAFQKRYKNVTKDMSTDITLNSKDQKDLDNSTPESTSGSGLSSESSSLILQSLYPSSDSKSGASCDTATNIKGLNESLLSKRFAKQQVSESIEEDSFGLIASKIQPKLKYNVNQTMFHSSQHMESASDYRESNKESRIEESIGSQDSSSLKSFVHKKNERSGFPDTSSTGTRFHVNAKHNDLQSETSDESGPTKLRITNMSRSQNKDNLNSTTLEEQNIAANTETDTINSRYYSHKTSSKHTHSVSKSKQLTTCDTESILSKKQTYTNIPDEIETDITLNSEFHRSKKEGFVVRSVLDNSHQNLETSSDIDIAARKNKRKEEKHNRNNNHLYLSDGFSAGSSGSVFDSISQIKRRDSCITVSEFSDISIGAHRKANEQNLHVDAHNKKYTKIINEISTEFSLSSNFRHSQSNVEESTQIYQTSSDYGSNVFNDYDENYELKSKDIEFVTTKERSLESTQPLIDSLKYELEPSDTQDGSLVIESERINGPVIVKADNYDTTVNSSHQSLQNPSEKRQNIVVDISSELSLKSLRNHETSFHEINEKSNSAPLESVSDLTIKLTDTSLISNKGLYQNKEYSQETEYDGDPSINSERIKIKKDDITEDVDFTIISEKKNIDKVLNTGFTDVDIQQQYSTETLPQNALGLNYNDVMNEVESKISLRSIIENGSSSESIPTSLSEKASESQMDSGQDSSSWIESQVQNKDKQPSLSNATRSTLYDSIDTKLSIHEISSNPGTSIESRVQFHEASPLRGQKETMYNSSAITECDSSHHKSRNKDNHAEYKKIYDDISSDIFLASSFEKNQHEFDTTETLSYKTYDDTGELQSSVFNFKNSKDNATSKSSDITADFTIKSENAGDHGGYSSKVVSTLQSERSCMHLRKAMPPSIESSDNITHHSGCESIDNVRRIMDNIDSEIDIGTERYASFGKGGSGKPHTELSDGHVYSQYSDTSDKTNSSIISQKAKFGSLIRNHDKYPNSSDSSSLSFSSKKTKVQVEESSISNISINSRLENKGIVKDRDEFDKEDEENNIIETDKQSVKKDNKLRYENEIEGIDTEISINTRIHEKDNKDDYTSTKFVSVNSETNDSNVYESELTSKNENMERMTNNNLYVKDHDKYPNSSDSSSLSFSSKKTKVQVGESSISNISINSRLENKGIVKDRDEFDKEDEDNDTIKSDKQSVKKDNKLRYENEIEGIDTDISINNQRDEKNSSNESRDNSRSQKFSKPKKSNISDTSSISSRPIEKKKGENSMESIPSKKSISTMGLTPDSGTSVELQSIKTSGDVHMMSSIRECITNKTQSDLTNYDATDSSLGSALKVMPEPNDRSSQRSNVLSSASLKSSKNIKNSVNSSGDSTSTVAHTKSHDKHGKSSIRSDIVRDELSGYDDSSRSMQSKRIEIENVQSSMLDSIPCGSESLETKKVKNKEVKDETSEVRSSTELGSQNVSGQNSKSKNGSKLNHVESVNGSYVCSGATLSSRKDGTVESNRNKTSATTQISSKKDQKSTRQEESHTYISTISNGSSPRAYLPRRDIEDDSSSSHTRKKVGAKSRLSVKQKPGISSKSVNADETDTTSSEFRVEENAGIKRAEVPPENANIKLIRNRAPELSEESAITSIRSGKHKYLYNESDDDGYELNFSESFKTMKSNISKNSIASSESSTLKSMSKVKGKSETDDVSKDEYISIDEETSYFMNGSTAYNYYEYTAEGSPDRVDSKSVNSPESK